MTEPHAGDEAPAFEITQSPSGDSVVVELQGELDIAGAPELERQLSSLTETGVNRIVIDLRSLDFMDSTGLSVLIRLRRAAESAGCRVALRRGNERIERLLERSGTREEFVFVDP